MAEAGFPPWWVLNIPFQELLQEMCSRAALGMLVSQSQGEY